MNYEKLGGALALISALSGGCHSPTQEELASKQGIEKSITVGQEKCNEIMDIIGKSNNGAEFVTLRNKNHKIVIARTNRDTDNADKSIGIAALKGQYFYSGKDGIISPKIMGEIAQILISGDLAGCTYYRPHLSKDPTPLFWKTGNELSKSEKLAHELNGDTNNFSETPEKK